MRNVTYLNRCTLDVIQLKMLHLKLRIARDF